MIHNPQSLTNDYCIGFFYLIETMTGRPLPRNPSSEGGNGQHDQNIQALDVPDSSNNDQWARIRALMLAQIDQLRQIVIGILSLQALLAEK